MLVGAAYGASKSKRHKEERFFFVPLCLRAFVLKRQRPYSVAP